MFAEAANAAGVQAMVAAPLVSRGRCWGVLDLYWCDVVDFDEAERGEVELLAKVAASYLVIADDRRVAGIAREQLAARLVHDPLTGLANRELIHELIYHALANVGRRRRSVALLFVDLDGFKAVNDTRGHRAGDIVLRTVAHRMRAAVRNSDTVSRLGGDEFLVLCEDLRGDAVHDGLTDLGERILAEIGRPIAVDAAPPITISASIGIAITSTGGSVTNFIHDADQAMYRAKQRPGSSLAIHHADGSHRVREHEIFGALDRGELRVFYQPIVTATGSVAAVEALLRWEHPALGLLEANAFIDFAISTGAITNIGHWVIGEALQQLRSWRNTDRDAAPGTVFVNLTPLELIDPQLITVIDSQVRDNDLPAMALGIEITEQAFADARALPSAAYFRSQGHPLALDDFGTGYSSLARLVQLPVTHLKLDRLLVAGLPADPQPRALLKAVLLIADSMGLQVIAEGVENAGQAAYLTDAGCHFQQGFHHGRPHPAHNLIPPQRTTTQPAHPPPPPDGHIRNTASAREAPTKRAFQGRSAELR